MRVKFAVQSVLICLLLAIEVPYRALRHGVLLRGEDGPNEKVTKHTNAWQTVAREVMRPPGSPHEPVLLPNHLTGRQRAQKGRCPAAPMCQADQSRTSKDSSRRESSKQSRYSWGRRIPCIRTGPRWGNPPGQNEQIPYSVSARVISVSSSSREMQSKGSQKGSSNLLKWPIFQLRVQLPAACSAKTTTNARYSGNNYCYDFISMHNSSNSRCWATSLTPDMTVVTDPTTPSSCFQRRCWRPKDRITEVQSSIGRTAMEDQAANTAVAAQTRTQEVRGKRWQNDIHWDTEWENSRDPAYASQQSKANGTTAKGRRSYQQFVYTMSSNARYSSEAWNNFSYDVPVNSETSIKL